MTSNLLLESHLRSLRLATFRQQYRQVAEDAARNNLDYERYQRVFGKPLQPVLVEQTSDTGDGLVRDWPRPDTGVGTHISYPIQWFGLAAAIMVLWLVMNVKREDAAEDK